MRNDLIPPEVQVQMRESTYKFLLREINEIHALCDAAEVPRTTADGSVFSMAQRVRILTYTIEGSRAAIRKAKGDIPH